MNQELHHYLKRSIDNKELSVKLLNAYKDVVNSFNGKVVNKNLTHFKSADCHYRLIFNDYSIDLMITPLNSEGYSAYSYTESKDDLNATYWLGCNDFEDLKLFYVPEGKTKEVLNADNLNKVIDAMITRKLADIQKLLNVNDEMISKFILMYDEYVSLVKDLNAFMSINNSSFRETLDRFNIKTPKGNTLTNRWNTIY